MICAAFLIYSVHRNSFIIIFKLLHFICICQSHLGMVCLPMFMQLTLIYITTLFNLLIVDPCLLGVWSHLQISIHIDIIMFLMTKIFEVLYCTGDTATGFTSTLNSRVKSVFTSGDICVHVKHHISNINCLFYYYGLMRMSSCRCSLTFTFSQTCVGLILISTLYYMPNTNTVLIVCLSNMSFSDPVKFHYIVCSVKYSDESHFNCCRSFLSVWNYITYGVYLKNKSLFSKHSKTHYLTLIKHIRFLFTKRP